MNAAKLLPKSKKLRERIIELLVDSVYIADAGNPEDAAGGKDYLISLADSILEVIYETLAEETQ